MLTHLSKHRATGPEDLVDLLGECHERIRRFVAMARQAGSRQGVPADQIAQACIHVERYFTQALPLHVADEEQSIEPRLPWAVADGGRGPGRRGAATPAARA